MKTQVLRCNFFLAGILLCSIGHAAVITWTNTAPGNVWSVAANWYPNQVPGPNDTAVIPLAATNGAALDMTATVQNLILVGGNLANTGYAYDTLTVNGQINWTNGVLGCATTNNGVLTLAGTNGVDYQLTQFLCNNGTINLVSGNLLINYCGYNSGSFFNASNAVLNFQHDAAIDISSGQFGLCNPPFNNAGIIRKSGGTGTSPIYAAVNSSGTIDAQTGAIQLNGGGNLGGTLQSEATGELIFGTNIYNTGLTLAGNLTSTNAVLDGANLVGSGTINGVLTWVSGGFTPGDGTLTVGTNGVLVLAGANGADYSLSSELYNQGTIKLVSGNLLINSCGGNFGELINDPSGLVDFKNDVSIDSSCGGPLINQGTVRKSGGTGTSDIGAFFSNSSGTLDAQTGTIGLTNSYYLVGGTLNFGISGLTSYGQIYLSGISTLSGSLSINLNDGYTPTNSDVFPLLTYASESGVFTNMTLPTWINWQSNYSSTTFTLTVSNLDGKPVLASATVPAPGQFSFQFAGNPNGNYSVLATTNLILPLADWTTLGTASLVSNDLFQYVDQHATNYPQRFYKLRSP
ncbi:MAG: hypothetical protein ACLQSR_04605 [Limisphaerales bacterium]